MSETQHLHLPADARYHEIPIAETDGFFLTNTGTTLLHVIYADTEPSAGSEGHVVRLWDSHERIAEGRVWLRGNGRISYTVKDFIPLVRSVTVVL